jgi:hypothetical protein
MARAAGRSTAGGRAHPPPIRVDSDSAFQLALGRARDAVKTREREYGEIRRRREHKRNGSPSYAPPAGPARRQRPLVLPVAVGPVRGSGSGSRRRESILGGAVSR